MILIGQWWVGEDFKQTTQISFNPKWGRRSLNKTKAVLCYGLTAVECHEVTFWEKECQLTSTALSRAADVSSEDGKDPTWQPLRPSPPTQRRRKGKNILTSTTAWSVVLVHRQWCWRWRGACFWLLWTSELCQEEIEREQTDLYQPRNHEREGPAPHRLSALCEGTRISVYLKQLNQLWRIPANQKMKNVSLYHSYSIWSSRYYDAIEGVNKPLMER